MCCSKRNFVLGATLSVTSKREFEDARGRINRCSGRSKKLLESEGPYLDRRIF